MALQDLAKKRESRAPLPPLVVDRNEAATLLRISTRKLDYLIGRGAICPVRIDGRVLIAWVELLRFIKSMTAGEKSRESSSALRDSRVIDAQEPLNSEIYVEGS